MIKIIRITGVSLLICLFGQSLLAQSWSVVGNAGFSDGYVNTTRIAVAPDGTPYVVYYDAPNQGNVSVKKFNGTAWVTVGTPGFSDGLVNNTDIAIDPSGAPHVVYYDAASGGKATVKKFNGSSWVTLGNAGFSDGFVNNTSIAISNAGIPYVVYYDAANGGKATVQRFINNAWQNVGAPAFSDGFVNNTDIAIDPSGVPYVVYYDAPNGGEATVKKYNGSIWQTVGAEAFSDGLVNYTTIAISNTGIPYVAYYDAEHGGKATVKKFNGSSWATVGVEGFSDSYATYIDIAITPSGVPYVVYIDASRGAKATVERFNGTSWEYAGTPGLSAGIVNNTAIAIGGTGTAYVVYYDAANGGRATVQKYVSAVNPADSLVLVELYNNTGGNNWINKTGWLTGPARTWHGIAINDEGRVTGINLFSNNLTGSLPASLGNLSRLSTLYLYRNRLTGSIPASLGNLSILQVLSLGENRLTGSIPGSLANCNFLNTVDFQTNLLTGSIPPELGNSEYRRYFNVQNNQLTGTIPVSFGNMPNIRNLILGNNQLSGTIPVELGNLSTLEELALELNQLTGTIPQELGNLASLTTLILGNNNLSGTIPASLGNCTQLNRLYLAYNANLTGTIPSSLGNLTQLKSLWIGNANIEGIIPASLGNLYYLEQLIISNTKVGGIIPNSLGSLSRLTQLSLNNNQLVGPIPAALGNLFSLTDLHLNNNQLSGSIPQSLTGLNNIRSFGAGLNIANNRFTFDGMEALALKFPAANYSPQAPIPFFSGGCIIWTAPGGNMGNNTFTFFRQAPVFSFEAQVTGNPFFNPTKSGKYVVQVTNSIANRLTLTTEPTDARITFPTQPQQYTANREETDTLGWTHYYYDYTDPVTSQPDFKLLLSLKKNGNNIGTIAAGNLQVKVAATSGAGTGQGLLLTSPLITNQSGYYVMHRYWSVVPANQPTTPVGVRFYYNDQDFTDVKGSVSSLVDHKSLFFYKTEGGNPDPASNIAGATKLYSIANGTNPKLDTFVYVGQGCGQHMAEYMVKSFSGGGGGGTLNGQAILPVKLSLFTGRLVDDAAVLYWETAQEQSASHFNIQRSINGVDFVSIGKVKATGNSTTRKKYSFTDQAAGSLRADKIYYRLQTQDINDKQELSKVIILKPGTSVRNIQLAANPVTDYAYLLMQAKEKSNVTILITDMAGRTLLSQSRSVERGMNNLPVNVQSLAAGIYMLSVKNADGIQTVRFIKK